jgi:hypothetical protein
LRRLLPNKPPKPTADGAGSSAIVGGVAGSACLSFLR